MSSSQYTLNVKYSSTVCGGKDDQLIVTAIQIRNKYDRSDSMKVLILDNVDDLNFVSDAILRSETKDNVTPLRVSTQLFISPYKKEWCLIIKFHVR